MKGACIFHLILVGIVSILILSVKNIRTWGWVLLRGLFNGRNPLSMAKVICRQSLTEKHRKINHMIIFMIQSVIFTSAAFEAFAKAMFFCICSICLGKKILK